MSDVAALLQGAADRGVQVTIFVNDRPETPPLRFKWDHKVHRDCAISTFKAAGLTLRVIDWDGDASGWTLKRGKDLIAEGEDWGWNPYHFDACLMAAEAAMTAHVRALIASRAGARP